MPDLFHRHPMAQIELLGRYACCSNCKAEFTNILHVEQDFSPWFGYDRITARIEVVGTPTPTSRIDEQLMRGALSPRLDPAILTTPDPMAEWVAEEERSERLDAQLAELASERVTRSTS